MQTLNIPLQQKERLFLLDVIRGVALCGILILNIYYFARPTPAIFNLNVYNEDTNSLNVAWWYLTMFMVEGSYRALFSMLFGAGAILLITRLEKGTGIGAADVYYTRLIWLLIFGVVNAFVLLWPGDILYSYAVCGLFLFPFRKSSVRLLIAMACFFLAITVFKGWLQERDRLAVREKGLAAKALEEKKTKLTDEQKKDLETWNDAVKARKVETVHKKAEKEIKEMRGSYATVWAYLEPINSKMQSSIFYDNLFFDVMIFAFFGMAFYKIGMFTGNFQTWVYVLFAAGGYTTGLLWGVFTGMDWQAADYSFYTFVETRRVPFGMYQVHRLLVALGHIGLVVLLWKSNLFPWFLKLLANVGQMAFSNYLGQSVICTLIFYGYGLGYFGVLERYELAYVVGGVWLFQIIFSALWLRYFLFGPLEWVWRSLTYWKPQPMLRSKTTAVLVVA